jgi:hypothetical protein
MFSLPLVTPGSTGSFIPISISGFEAAYVTPDAVNGFTVLFNPSYSPSHENDIPTIYQAAMNIIQASKDQDPDNYAKGLAYFSKQIDAYKNQSQDEVIAAEKTKPLNTNVQPSNISLSEPVKPVIVSSIISNEFLVHPITKFLYQKNSLNGFGDIFSSAWNTVTSGVKSILGVGTKTASGVVSTVAPVTSVTITVVRGTTSTVTRAAAPVVTPVVKTVAPVVAPVIAPVIAVANIAAKAITGQPLISTPTATAPVKQAATPTTIITTVQPATPTSTLPTNVQGFSLDHPLTRIIPKG